MCHVDIYWISIPDNLSISKIEPKLNILNEQELTIYHRYRVDFKKVEFLLGRIMLKTQLAERLQVRANQIEFVKNQHGKLFLHPSHNAPIHFNLAHTHGLIAVAFHSFQAIGIDVEDMTNDHLDLIPSVFQQHEADSIYAKSSYQERTRLFYTLWTRKEAYVKALGTGFYLSPDSFCVPEGVGRSRSGSSEFYTISPTPKHMLSTVITNPYSIEVEYRVSELALSRFC